jgi:hypothetical protein
MTGIEEIADSISAELQDRLPRQRKTQRTKLALLVATMLDVRSANLMDLAAGLPRQADRTDMRYQWITRLLGNPLVISDEIMEPFSREVLERAAATGEPLSLILDQSKMSDRHQVLMLALRWGERALPLAWRVEETDGAIGFDTQQALLEAVARWLPEEASVRLMGDRFYGTADLIGWCQGRGWDYRLRLKGNLAVFDATGKTTTGQCAKDRVYYLENVELTARRARTHIGIIHDPGHAEPWIIAMSEKPSYLRTLEYSARWGIEPMFSDFKSRGFGIEDTQLRRPPRSLDPCHVPGPLRGSVYRPVGRRSSSNSERKKSPADQPRKVARSRTSWFTRGLRRIVKLMQSCLPLPQLWAVLLN